MAQFDPYRKWLGIPPEEQPPNHYRLLGIGLFESDPDVISNAADRQMVHVRSFQTGKYSELSQRILNELSAARVCLLDPKRKSEYDRQLRAELAAKRPGPPPPRTAALSPPLAGDAAPAAPQLAAGPRDVTGPARSTARAARRKKSAWQGAAVTLVLVSVSIVLLVWALSNSQSAGPDKSGSPAVKRGGDGSSRTRPSNRDGQRRDGRPPHELPAEEQPTPDEGSGNPPVSSDSPGEIRRFEGHTAAVTSAIFMPGGKSLLSGSDDRSVRQWNLESGEEQCRLEGSSDPILSVTCTPNGDKVLASSGRANPPSGGFVHIWQLPDGQQTDRINVSKAELAWDADFSPDGQYILLACEDRTLRLLRAADKKEIRQLSGHEGSVRSAGFSADGSRILSGSADQTVRLWNTDDGKQIHRLIGHQGAVTAVAISPGGDLAASGGVDKTLRLWDLNTGTQRHACQGHLDVVTCAAFSPDGRFVLSGSGSLDGTIRLWRVADAAQLHCFEKCERAVRSVAFSPDGRRALSAGDDGVVRLWRLPEESAMPVLPAHVAGGPDGQTPSAQGPKPGRLPVPDPESQKQAEDAIRNGELKKNFAATSRPAKRALVKRLLEKAAALKDDATTAYVLLRLARDEATTLGNAGAALAAVGAIGKRYQIDVISEKTEALKAVAQVTAAPGRKLLVAGKIVTVADEALAAGDVDAAERLVEIARPLAATKVRDGVLSLGRHSQGALSGLVEERAKRIAQVKLGAAGTDPEPGTPTDPNTLSVLGGNDASEAAVESALDWLARHQNDNGSWSFDHIGEQCRDECPDPGRLADAPNTATALALLPFLGAGHGPRQGKFKDNVARGLEFLKGQLHPIPGPRPAGTLYESAAAQMPSHALGTIALCEACGVSPEMQTRAAATAAVEFAVRTQQSDGGWPEKLPTPGQAAGQSTVYATGWNLAALKTAQWAGLKLKISPNRFQRAGEYLQNMRTEDQAGYRRSDKATGRDAAATAVAVLSQMCLGRPRDNQELADYVDTLSRSGPSTKGLFDLNYHNSQIMRHYGGPAWAKWNTPLRDHLIATQETKGHAAGSWFIESNDWTTAAGGRLFCTAVAALILEVYYRHPPLYQ